LGGRREFWPLLFGKVAIVAFKRGNGFDRGSRSGRAIVCWAPNRAAGEAESGARERAL